MGNTDDPKGGQGVPPRKPRKKRRPAVGATMQEAADVLVADDRIVSVLIVVSRRVNDDVREAMTLHRGEPGTERWLLENAADDMEIDWSDAEGADDDDD